MFYGSTLQLAEWPNIKQPCGFFVFDDGIVAIRPPLGSVTINANEANNIRAMGMVCVYGIELVNGMPDITAKAFASTMKTISDPTGRTVQTEVVAMSSVTSAELSKNGLLGAKVTIQIEGKPQPAVLVGGRSAAKEFGSFLAQPLGGRFTTSLR